METIKRYQNRKLYSTKTNSYVTLKYVTELVKTNTLFNVIDNKSKKDITALTLKQALLTIDIKPVDVLKLIRGK